MFRQKLLSSYKALEVEFISRKNANYITNYGMYIKPGNVKIKKIISDLRNAIVDSKKVVLFEYEMPFLSLVETW